MSNLAAIKSDTLRPRHFLTVVTVSLVVIGCLAVLSAADGSATGSAFSYFAKAALFGTVGCALMVWLGRGGGRKQRGGLVMAHRFSMLLLAAGFAGVLFVMLPTPITPAVNGAKQWIVLPGFTIQPSEILKPALVLHLAVIFARDPWRTNSWQGMKPALLVSGAGLGVIAQQDLGSAMVTGAVLMTLFFAAGVRLPIMGGITGAAFAGVIGLVLIAPERISRMTVFLAPFADRYDAGFQITNGLMAIGAGGLFGNGIGQSLQKHIIPEPQTDFILPVIMEEIGFLGASVIMLLYLALVLLGLRIARGTKDPYERLVATGLTSIILWQAALNIWVVLGIAPLTGVPLPLISAGSTSQLILLAVIGLLIDIDRRSEQPTVALVLPRPAPRAIRRATEPPIQTEVAPAPLPGELRVVDQRIRASRGPGQSGGPAAQSGRPAAPSGSGRPATAPRPAATVVERVGDLELLADGSVRLPSGRVGKPRKPLALPDGRVLMPDGTLVSRERATLHAHRAGRSQ